MAINDLRRLREISQGTLETLTHAMEPLGTWEHDLQDSLQQSAQQALASWRTELHRAEDHWNTLRQRAQLQHQLAEMVADLDARLLVGQQQLEQLAAAARMLAEERDAARESLNILEKESGPGTRELRLQLDQLNAAERRLSRRETETRSALATLTERQQQQNLQLPRLDHDLQAAARRADEQRERRLTLQTRHPDLSEVDQDSLFERLTGRSVTQLREVYSVLPFGNSVVTRTVTGTQLYAVLENSVSSLPGSNGRFLQISGFSYRYDVSKPVGSRVVSVTLDGGAPITKDTTSYTLALPDFTNAGGDGYTMLADGQGTSREQDAQVVLDAIKAQGTITPNPKLGQRIQAVTAP